MCCVISAITSQLNDYLFGYFGMSDFLFAIVVIFPSKKAKIQHKITHSAWYQNFSWRQSLKLTWTYTNTIGTNKHFPIKNNIVSFPWLLPKMDCIQFCLCQWTWYKMYIHFQDSNIWILDTGHLFYSNISRRLLKQNYYLPTSDTCWNVPKHLIHQTFWANEILTEVKQTQTALKLYTSQVQYGRKDFPWQSELTSERTIWS